MLTVWLLCPARPPPWLGASITGVAAVLLLVFLGPLYRRLHAASASASAAVVAVGGGVLVVGTMVDEAYNALALATATELRDGVTAQVLITSGWDTARVFALPPLAMVAAAVVAGRGSGILPRWFRWFSVGMLLLLGLAPVGPAGLLGALGLLWVLIASLVLASDPSSTEGTPDGVG